MDWSVEHHQKDVAELHGLGLPDRVDRTLRWCLPTNSALVLGSAQPDASVDERRAKDLGIEIVRRRTGGGAVLVEPLDIVWFDILLPRNDPLWHEDVGRAFYWLGQVLERSLTGLITGVPVSRVGGMVSSAWSPIVCFAGLGPGEVTVAGRKLVGLSQRRTRSGALFQVSFYRLFDVDRMVSLIQLPSSEKAALTQVLQSVMSVPEFDLDAFQKRVLTELGALAY